MNSKTQGVDRRTATHSNENHQLKETNPMIIDKQDVLSDSQAITVSAASGNTIDTTFAGNQPSLFLVIRSVAAAAADGAATVEFALETDSDPNFGTPVTLFSTGPIAKTALTANTFVVPGAPLPLGSKRYLRLFYVVSTGPLTGGSFDAFISNIPADVRF